MRRLLTALALLLPLPAWAAQSAPVVSPEARVALVSATTAAPAGGIVDLGLDFRMAPGWHIYWRNPGDAGLPLHLALKRPAGAGPILWPAPHRMRQAGLMTYGYSGRVLLPFTVRAPPGGLAVQAHAEWLICKDVCIPERGDFSLVLPQGAATPSREAPLFAAAAAATPGAAPWKIHIAADGRLWFRPDAGIAAAYFFALTPGEVRPAARQRLARAAGVASLRLPLAKGFAPTAGIAGVLRVRLVGGGTRVFAVRATPAPAPAIAAGPPLWRLLLLAFLGGLILNLMPCVFPVLAMKALALARMSGAERGRARESAVAYTLGVLAMFLALAGILLVLRAGGSAAGWGFQFAAPIFVVAMAWLIFAVGLALSGVIEIGGGLAGTGDALAARGGWVGSFFTGLLSVLVAAPCTAPFMAAAIGAALAASAATTLAVFAALGLGLAFPYAALALSPGAARLLPRPGLWMEVLRQGLAFPMYGASAWLVWVASAEAGPSGVAVAAGGIVLIGFAAWVLGLARGGSARGRRAAGGLALAALLGAGALLVALRGAAPPAAGQAARGLAFSPARLGRLRRSGQAVFVEITAAWCLTCQINDRVALDVRRVRRAFAAGSVAYLVGDWTRQPAAITAYLAAHGREGVPLYVYYPPHRRGRILSQILTPGIVLRAISG